MCYGYGCDGCCFSTSQHTVPAQCIRAAISQCNDVSPMIMVRRHHHHHVVDVQYVLGRACVRMGCLYGVNQSLSWLRGRRLGYQLSAALNSPRWSAGYSVEALVRCDAVCVYSIYVTRQVNIKHPGITMMGIDVDDVLYRNSKSACSACSERNLALRISNSKVLDPKWLTYLSRHPRSSYVLPDVVLHDVRLHAIGCLMSVLEHSDDVFRSRTIVCNASDRYISCLDFRRTG